MIDNELKKLGENLKRVINEQTEIARKELSRLPEGENKEHLRSLISRASAGELAIEEAKEAIKNLDKLYAC